MDKLDFDFFLTDKEVKFYSANSQTVMNIIIILILNINEIHL